jgi:4-carboxymuconolactone decarboxylase
MMMHLWQLALSALVGAVTIPPAMAQPSSGTPSSDQAYPADVYPESGFRLPPPKREDLDAGAQGVYDMLADPKGGTLAGLRGPGGIQLLSPKLSELSRPLNRYLRQEAGLTGHVRELAILTTARAFDSQFEWLAHEGEALRQGVPQDVIDVVKHAKSTQGLAEADAVIIELGREAFIAKKVSSATFGRALKQFGQKSLVDIVALMGNYAGTAALLATFDMQLPPGQKPLLPIP